MYANSLQQPLKSDPAGASFLPKSDSLTVAFDIGQPPGCYSLHQPLKSDPAGVPFLSKSYAPIVAFDIGQPPG
ncbi:hypothetical protein V6N11_035515 [Hibiscus sabdariffa]|uniref:Uncharacterized protein n=1 Tax=Hibiscus sabdariffa TaxID=183260 RepID=A0ABR2R0G8_9ROSI